MTAGCDLLDKLLNDVRVASPNQANSQIRIFLRQATSGINQQIDALIPFKPADEDDRGAL